MHLCIFTNNSWITFYIFYPAVGQPKNARSGVLALIYPTIAILSLCDVEGTIFSRQHTIRDKLIPSSDIHWTMWSCIENGLCGLNFLSYETGENTIALNVLDLIKFGQNTKYVCHISHLTSTGANGTSDENDFANLL